MIASRTGEISSAKDLASVTDAVLPQVTKFLESPAEQKLRRMREGVITASVGAGVALMFGIFRLVFSLPFLFPAGAGLIVFFIGMGILINGLYLTTLPKTVADRPIEAEHRRELDKSLTAAEYQTGQIRLVKDNISQVISLTEHTTHQLKKD